MREVVEMASGSLECGAHRFEAMEDWTRRRDWLSARLLLYAKLAVVLNLAGLIRRAYDIRQPRTRCRLLP